MTTSSTTIAAAIAPTADAECAKQLAHLCDRHRTMLWLSLAIIVAAFMLQTRPTGQVGPAFLPEVSLPTLCGSRALFGIECPGCGLTRSFIALAAGNIRQSIVYHRLGWLFALAVVLQIPYRLYCLRELRTNIPTRVWPTWFGYMLIAALVLNWLLAIGGCY